MAVEKCFFSLYENEGGGNRPSHSGNGEMNKDQLKRLVEAMKKSTTGTITLDIAAWDKVSKNGKPYFFTLIDVQDEKYASKSEPADDKEDWE